MANQDIIAAKERVRALRSQVRQTQNDNAVAQAESAEAYSLMALDQEEASLLRQLQEVQSVVVPGAENIPLPLTDEVISVNEQGDPVRLDVTQAPPEGMSFMEVVDSRGNLVRVPLQSADVPVAPSTPVAPVIEGLPATEPPDATPSEVAPEVSPDATVTLADPSADAPEDLGTVEADAPPLDVADDATMSSRKPRR